MSTHIMQDKKVMGGVPVIRGTRVAVSSIILLIARGKSIDDITTVYYPFLNANDVKKSLQEHAENIKNTINDK